MSHSVGIILRTRRSTSAGNGGAPTNASSLVRVRSRLFRQLRVEMVEKKTSGNQIAKFKYQGQCVKVPVEPEVLNVQWSPSAWLCERPPRDISLLGLRLAGQAGTKVRSQDPGQRRVLDRAARQRRINRQLEALENDNFQDDPHAGLPQLGKRLPQFDDDADTGKKKKKTRGDHFKLRFRKNFQALLEEQNLSVAEGPNYLTACAGPPSRPQRPFCAVCGFPSPYTCVSCGARYCTVRCLGTHQETRCLKWTV
ncbi:zinc finger HIT domain-containing protein 1 isoform X1 [Talpa occidentalis]|nr:zinc finger HIT domain-containing protein 1 isoform X1 [Talpa occidentalis]XP_037362805.1 zinc finger HIT domain-containing protein 1 isoform X1 [Talpa occidentalis]XP_054549607.1 zinc finger HIT domain-containing protein 1 isoform X1 [Talpa occidentalis]